MNETASRIEMLIYAERYPDALRLIGPELASAPQDPVLWALATRAQLGSEQWAEALDSAGRVVALTPEQGLGHLYASIALSGLDRRPQALEAALEAVRLTPLHPTYHLQVAECASAVKGRKELAWSAANRAVELAPNSAETHAGMGLVALRTGRTDVAEQALLRALELDPGNHRAQHNLGLVRLQAGDMATAAKDLQTSAAADPGSELSRQAFRVLILRSLQRVHWGLWGAWLALSMLSRTEGPGPRIELIVCLLVVLTVLGVWLYRNLKRVDAQLRLVLWRMLRSSATAAGWFGCVLLAFGFLVVAALVPSAEFRNDCISFAGWSLLVGCLVSWLEVGRSRRRRRR